MPSYKKLCFDLLLNKDTDTYIFGEIFVAIIACKYPANPLVVYNFTSAGQLKILSTIKARTIKANTAKTFIKNI